MTAPGTTGASCYRNASSTTAADFLFDVKPIYPTCGKLPDGSPRWCGCRDARVRLVVHDLVRRLDDGAVPEGPIKVCFPHVYGRDKLLHYNAATRQWEDITIQRVTANHPVCG